MYIFLTHDNVITHDSTANYLNIPTKIKKTISLTLCTQQIDLDKVIQAFHTLLTTSIIYQNVLKCFLGTTYNQNIFVAISAVVYSMFAGLTWSNNITPFSNV